MEKEKYLLIGILAIAVISLAFTAFNIFGGNQPAQPNSADAQNSAKSQYQTKTSEGEVTIDITPKGLNNGNMIFDISFNTHTVDLTQFDLKKLVVLEADGRQIAPSSAPSLSGHHNSGELAFNTGKDLNRFKIKINEIPDVKERVLEWP
ncbi:hypothetical protein HYU10_04335 [Candidatus Woesearchaeota archaeon]|nr:hypothetical protein [Candidatus Woesearchaeota archaeon]MBI2130970.1 hypothetical protein [Candidatus Woesearchaeota archaeon]MBI2660832.1 hypothetical protein [Candidatus Woesearchaeota archaeon]